MKKRVPYVAASVLAGVLLVGTLVVPATSQPEPQRVSLTLFDPRGSQFEKEFNEGPKRFSPGDWVLLREKMLDPTTCEKVGSILLHFQYLEPKGKQNGYARFFGDYLSPEGKITFQGAGLFSEFETEGGFAFAVTGGTDTYKDVTGDGGVTESGDTCDGKKGDLITLDLRLN